MDMSRWKKLCNWFDNTNNNPWRKMYQTSFADRNLIRNDLITLSQNTEKEYSFISQHLFSLKDQLFNDIGVINPYVFGQIYELLLILGHDTTNSNNTIWDYIHPQIVQVAKGLFADGYYAQACVDAFIEINSRVKKIYKKLKPDVEPIPDGVDVMNKIFSDKEPLLEICDRTTDTGRNIHNGTRFLFVGAISALRNPKSHENIVLEEDDAVRRLMLASLLMYKLDEAVKLSGII